MLEEALAEIRSAPDARALQQVRVAWLGRKGRVTERLKTLGGLAPEERRAAGAEINALKQALEQAFEPSSRRSSRRSMSVSTSSKRPPSRPSSSANASTSRSLACGPPPAPTTCSRR